MTTAISFFCQNDNGSRMSNTQYWESLIFVVILISESKALYPCMPITIIVFGWL